MDCITRKPGTAFLHMSEEAGRQIINKMVENQGGRKMKPGTSANRKSLYFILRHPLLFLSLNMNFLESENRGSVSRKRIIKGVRLPVTFAQGGLIAWSLGGGKHTMFAV